MTPEEFVKKVDEIKMNGELGETKTETEIRCYLELGMDVATFRMAYEAAKQALKYTHQLEVFEKNPMDPLTAMAVLRDHYGLPQNPEQDKKHIETRVLPGENHWL